MARWELIDGYPDYMVSDEGDVAKIMLDGSVIDVPKRFDELGFQVVDLRRPNGVDVEVVVSRAVCEAFTPTHYGEKNPPKGAWDRIEENEIIHLDGDLSNNRFDNLKWVRHGDPRDDKLRNDYILKTQKTEIVRERTERRGRPGNAVVCENVKTGEVLRFETQDEAEAYLGVKNISPVLSGKQKTAAGYRIWKE